ncbi:MAG: N-acetyl-gamma-glutamyl-phosphate reductase [Chloroflexota bacterium]|nr:N-acetyl-gamma-glutamyl-phosphate reductase [Chloroflexota bacterium]
MLNVGIINITGYAGAEIARLVYSHPELELASATGRSKAGLNLDEVFPHLEKTNIKIQEELSDNVDFVFSALPHAASAEKLSQYVDSGIPAIDISADFRLKDLSTYENWYEITHPRPELINQSAYGLPELHREDIKKSKLVANPGCFPTGGILSMSPAVSHNLIEELIIIDSKTGISGAGRTAKESFGFSELNDNCAAYGTKGHRHQPEMAQELNFLSDTKIKVLFTPHLVSMTRGILGTNYATLKKEIKEKDVVGLYKEFYKNEPFIKIVDAPPATKHTWGSNFVYLYPYVREETNTLVVISALDNLVKGSAGAAIQNLNIMQGFEETMGIGALPIYP